MAVAWGQRKALGKRYAIDPALQMEQERLAQEYALIPGREARALTAEQMEAQRQQEEENRKASEKSSMIGAAGNLLTTGLTVRALTKSPTEPFFGTWGSKAANVTPAVTPAATSTIAPIESFGITGTTTPTYGTGTTFTGATPQVAVNPALVDSTAVGLGTEATSATTAATPSVAPAASEGAAGTTSSSSSLSSVAGPVAIIGAAEAARGLWGGKGTSWDEKTTQQKLVDSPATAGMLASLIPGSIGAKEDTFLGQMYKNLAGAERTVMKPIDWIFGDK